MQLEVYFKNLTLIFIHGGESVAFLHFGILRYVLMCRIKPLPLHSNPCILRAFLLF